MTPREKNLLIFLGGTLFIIVNLFALNQFYLPKMQKATTAKSTAESDLNSAETTLQNATFYEPEIAWIKKSGTVAVSQFKAQSELQQFLRKQATARRLEVRDTDIMDYAEDAHFGRVKVSFKLTGMERDVVSWLTSIHRVEQRQVVTKLEMKVQNNDPTRVEVRVEVEKWIIPVDDV